MQKTVTENSKSAGHSADRYWLRSESSIVELSPTGAAPVSWLAEGRQILGHWPSSQGGMTSGFTIGPTFGLVSNQERFLHEGQVYEPGKHGFARKVDFSSEPQGNTVDFLYTYNPEQNPGVYPFRHEMKVVYALAENELTVRMSVKNQSEKKMYFGAGLHPAFAFPTDGSVITLLDTLPEGTRIYRSENSRILNGATVASPFEGLSWKLNPGTFDRDGYFFIFPEIPKNDVGLRLEAPDHSHALNVAMTGWGGFGVWSKPGKQEFVCIEPVIGVALIKGDAKSPRLEEIEGLAELEPGKSFSATFKARASLSHTL